MIKSIKVILTGEHSVTDSPIEEKLYKEFLTYNLKPITQYIEASFRIDLAFPEIPLAIEADGKEFHSTEEQKKRDEYKNRKLKERGWKVERLKGSFIHKYADVAVAKLILKYFDTKVSKDDLIRARGRIVSYFYRAGKDYDMALAKRMVDEFLEEEKLLNKYRN